MRVACVQFDTVWENKSANHAKARALLKSARLPKNSLVLLPEMFASGFSMNIAAISDAVPGGETTGFLSQLAQDFKVFILAGIVTSGRAGKGRNEALLHAPSGTLIARYQKIHPFTLGGETKHYSAGKKIVITKVNEFRVAPFICYDLRFPEVFRKAVRQGAQMFPVIASWPFPRDEHWITLLRARAIENQAYVIGSNRSGKDPKYVYPGRSMIVDSHGNILADAGAGEGVISAEADLDLLLKWRADFPALKDMK